MPAPEPKAPASRTPAQYERLGRVVEEALLQDYIDVLRSTRRQVWSSFVRGLFFGFGSFLGATVLVALLLAILQLAGGAPLIGHYFDELGRQIQQETPK
jgi:hypothetical protein